MFNKETKQLETKIYVKPTNIQLYLNFRSSHPPHVFKSLIFSEPLRAVMICSKKDWSIEYLRALREKFLAQEYPEQLIIE